QRLAYVVALGERDLLRAHAPGVLQLPEPVREELSLGDLRHHVDELLLHELKAGDRPLELHPLLRIRERRLVAGHRRADRAPDDAVARLVQTTEWPFEAAHVRQQRSVRYAHLLEDELGGDRRTKRELAFDVVA